MLKSGFFLLSALDYSEAHDPRTKFWVKVDQIIFNFFFIWKYMILISGLYFWKQMKVVL